MDAARSVIEGYKLGAGGIYISNNLHYIADLEDGSSTQRPEGMTEHGLTAAAIEFKKARIL